MHEGRSMTENVVSENEKKLGIHTGETLCNPQPSGFSG